jgi:hypothetical protein
LKVLQEKEKFQQLLFLVCFLKILIIQKINFLF